MVSTVKSPKKLIEVALPLDDINVACGREKSIRHGHPSTLHLWWSRKPLAVARAVIFAQLVNDPGFERSLGRGVNKEKARVKREKLFEIIRKLVLWENSNNEEVLAEANAEIWDSWRETCELNKSHPEASILFNPDHLPGFHDPFAGGGSLPLEAKRFGLNSYGSDLNPVSVLINKAMIEIPPVFVGVSPSGPIPTDEKQQGLCDEWNGTTGLAEDVRRYGIWMQKEAFNRIGKLYPQVDLPAEFGGGKSTVIAWLWARTVQTPNPAFSGVKVPLTTTYVLSSKAGKEAFVEPVIEGSTYRFVVKYGKYPKEIDDGTQISRGAFRCVLSNTPIKYEYIDDEANAGRLGACLLGVVAEGPKGRVYLTPTKEMEELALTASPAWRPETPCRGTFASNAQGRIYGFKTFGDYFTPRQLVTLNTFSDLILDVKEKAKEAAIKAGMQDDGNGLDTGGSGATAYGEAISVYLACALCKVANIGSSIASWMNDRGAFRETFARQAIPMTWSYAEANPFADAGGSFLTAISKGVMAIAAFPAKGRGFASQANASEQKISNNKVVATDPPYYDNIGYADLSDYFYVWLRRALRPIYPGLFSTIAVPKAEELMATQYRHGSKAAAEKFFLDGMTEAMGCLAENSHPAFPITIFYAFKQSESTEIGTGNTGWETFLEAVITSGLAITGTWPMRTESSGRMVGQGTNALASSIALVCRKRDIEALTVTRREFLRELKDELQGAVEVMIGGSEGVSPVAPVDLAQAVIGPGMAIFSKYSSVLEADGSAMTVHSALMLINKILTEGGDDFDSDSQFCIAWFDQYGWAEGPFGEANTLAQAKATSVGGVEQAGVVESGGSKVRLLKPADYPVDWSPEKDNRRPIWESLHQMIRAHHSGGDASAGALLARMHEHSEPIRLLAYRLYTLCERKGWSEDARSYNELITAWPHIESASHASGLVGSQAKLDI